MNLYSASSLKQQYLGRHVVVLGHINLIPSQPVFAQSLFYANYGHICSSADSNKNRFWHLIVIFETLCITFVLQRKVGNCNTFLNQYFLLVSGNFSLHLRVRVMVFKSHFQQYFSYIVAVSFIGGGNWSIRRKPLTWSKSLTNHYY